MTCALRRSELIAPQPAVDRDHRAGDVAGARAAQKAHEVRDLLRLAVAAGRDLVFALPLPVLGCVVAQDLLGVDPPGRDAVHRDAVAAHHAAQALGPAMDTGLGAERAVGVLRFALAGEVDDAAPAARDHGVD